MARTTGSSGPKTLEAIRTEGLRLIAEHGYEAMSLRQLAAEVGIQAGSLYNHIRTKQDLLFQLIKGHMDALIPAFDATVAGIDDPVERLRAFVAFHVNYHIVRARDVFVEVVTLLVPGFSDDPDDLRRMAGFLAGVDPLMPWHVTAFHPDYKFDRQKGFRETMPDDLYRAVELGRAAGLKYIYCGNLPGRVGDGEDTRCHECGVTLIERRHFSVRSCRVGADGKCPDCGTAIPGVWGKSTVREGRIRPLL